MRHSQDLGKRERMERAAERSKRKWRYLSKIQRITADREQGSDGPATGPETSPAPAHHLPPTCHEDEETHLPGYLDEL